MERAVETNQKHLIKKILARYPTQWTFFRELIQNSDDAQASQVVIEFFTTTTTPANTTAPVVCKTIVSNNGNKFSPADWSRLCSIASGNPDPSKVGFFGVGFYSVFALSDSPTVESGAVRLDFFWKGNALFTRETAREETDEWTRFLLPVQANDDGGAGGGGEPPPDFKEIGLFLCELLCFARNLRLVSVKCDGVLKVTAKREDLALDVRSPPNPVAASAAAGMSLSTLFNSISSATTAQASAAARFNMASEVMLFRTVITLSMQGEDAHSISLIRAQSRFATQLTSECARQYLDMTQKQHPKQVDVAILLSLQRAQANSALADKINPSSSASHRGRVFVGFVTSQTTGLGVHVSGPFIPTMEREHLDFSNEMAKQWNLALFQAVGRLNRIVHDCICGNPSLFASAQPLPLPQPAASKQEEDAHSWTSMMRKATASIFSALVTTTGGAAREQIAEDDALFSSLEQDTGAIAVLSMASFCPIPGECRPYSGVLSALWTAFLGEGEGPLVWTCQGRALSSDKVRLFPPQTGAQMMRLPPLSSIETFPVVASQLSRAVTDAGSRSTSALVSTFLHELLRAQRIHFFELSDIISELRCRPLRGVDETAGVLAWFVESEAEESAQQQQRRIAVRCSNCSAQLSIPVSQGKQGFTCTTCYCRLTLPRTALPGNAEDERNAAMRERQRIELWQCARCEIGKEMLAFAKWRYFLDDKTMDSSLLPLLFDSLPKLKEELCPLEISSQCALPSSLVSKLTLESWIRIVFTSSPPVSHDTAFRILHRVWFPRGSSLKLDSTAISALLKTLPCIPTTSNALALPAQVYVTEMEGEEKDALVLAALPRELIPQTDEAKFIQFLEALGVRQSISPLAMVKLFLRGGIGRPALWRYICTLVVDKRQVLDQEVVDLLAKSRCVSRVMGKEDELLLPKQVLLPSSPAVLELASLIPVLHVDEPELLPFFTKVLNLETMPSNEVLLKLASTSENASRLRVKAVALLCTNNTAGGRTLDLFASTTLPILPCLSPSSIAWAAPSQCYLSVPKHLAKSCAVCDVAMLEREGGLVNVKQQLGVAPFPPISLTVQYLANTKDDFDQVIDYLVQVQSHITDAEFAQLQALHLIPIPRTCLLFDANTNQLGYAPPTQCYFERKEENMMLASLFCFVSEAAWKKSPQHVYFYQRLGVRDAPTLNELAWALATRPKQTLERMGVDQYLALLRLIASSPDLTKVKKDTLVAMRDAACLLGHKPKSNGAAGAGEFGLYLAREMVIEDDSRYRRLFSDTPACPTGEPALERLYAALGCRPISAVVQETSRPSTAAHRLPLSRAAASLDQQLCYRLPILTQKCAANELNRAAVESWTLRAKQKRATKDFGREETSLVRQVDGIDCELRLQLPGAQPQTRRMNSTCCIFQDRICVTSIDYFHIASALVALFLTTRSNDRAFLWASLLQSTDQSLEEMGFVLPSDPVVLPKITLGQQQPQQEAVVKPSPPPAIAAPPPPPPVVTAPPPPVVAAPAKPSPPPAPTTIAPNPMPKPPPQLPLPNTTAAPLLPRQQPSKLVPPDMQKFRESAINSALKQCRSCDEPEIVTKSGEENKRLPTHDAMQDCTQPHDLVREEPGIGSIECFVPRHLARNGGSASPFQLYLAQAREFANLLVQLCMEVFELDAGVIHLFYDPRGITRAFNLNGALFFNLYCFVHDQDSIRAGKTWREWYGTFCHELSHNCWKPHDAHFANYLVVFCVEFADSLHRCLEVRGLL